MSYMPRNVIFCPHPGPQTAFIQSPVFETVFGGARGGGKTYACLGEFIIHSQQYGPKAKGLFLRRTRESLKDAIREAKTLFRLIAIWKSTKNEFHFNNGAVLVFNYLDKDDDAEQYQGHQYTRLYVEELTQFPSPDPILKMFATLRSAHGVPCQFRASCNPGGPGHNWVKARYVDNGPFEIITDEETGMKRVFIPARITDNPTLLANDPNYVNRLKMSGSEQLVRAWLEGDWSIIEGAFFAEWDKNKHILPHEAVMQQMEASGDWKVFISGDWGSARPFSFGWYAIVPDHFHIDSVMIPRGALIRIREYYGMKKGQFNVGVKATAEAVAAEIKHRNREKLLYGVLDPSAFRQDGGPSIAERMAAIGIRFRPADNKRVARKGAMGGWDMCRHRLEGEDGVPMFYVTEHSPHFIRTIPVLQHDKGNFEDLDTEAEDHIADEWRYGMMSRPWLPKRVSKASSKFYTADSFWEGITHNIKEERVRL
jgi:Terminase large subunit, T4likevirus-type, N-terminal